MKGNNLTPRQREVYEYIIKYIDSNRRSPFIREIQQDCNIFSYKSAVDKLLALEKKGFIKRTLNKHRSIKLKPIN